jgi:hypothetical protein
MVANVKADAPIFHNPLSALPSTTPVYYPLEKVFPFFGRLYRRQRSLDIYSNVGVLYAPMCLVSPL